MYWACVLLSTLLQKIPDSLHNIYLNTSQPLSYQEGDSLYCRRLRAWAYIGLCCAFRLGSIQLCDDDKVIDPVLECL